MDLSTHSNICWFKGEKKTNTDEKSLFLMQSADLYSQCYVILRLQSSQKLQKMQKILKYLDGGIGQVEQTFALPFTCQNLDSELFQMKNGNNVGTHSRHE